MLHHAGVGSCFCTPRRSMRSRGLALVERRLRHRTRTRCESRTLVHSANACLIYLCRSRSLAQRFSTVNCVLERHTHLASTTQTSPAHAISVHLQQLIVLSSICAACRPFHPAIYARSVCPRPRRSRMHSSYAHMHASLDICWCFRKRYDLGFVIHCYEDAAIRLGKHSLLAIGLD